MSERVPHNCYRESRVVKTRQLWSDYIFSQVRQSRNIQWDWKGLLKCIPSLGVEICFVFSALGWGSIAGEFRGLIMYWTPKAPGPLPQYNDVTWEMQGYGNLGFINHRCANMEKTPTQGKDNVHHVTKAWAVLCSMCLCTSGAWKTLEASSQYQAVTMTTKITNTPPSQRVQSGHLSYCYSLWQLDTYCKYIIFVWLLLQFTKYR